MRTRRRMVVFSCLGCVMFFFVVEVASFTALQTLSLIRPNLFVHGFVDSHFDSITDDYRRKFVDDGYYDPNLGWNNVPSTVHREENIAGQPYEMSYDADGSRSDDLPRKQLLINTYGDSFIACDEVDDDQTWQYFLESRIGYEVKNFGVAAYGTDQALLKLEKHVAQGVTAAITVLGILDENINRVVTSFRPFYDESTGVKLGFKPSFRSGESGSVEMIPSPYQERGASLEKLRALADRIAADDFWILVSRKIDIRFPYSLQLARAGSMITDRKLRDWSDEPSLVDSVNLWDAAEGRAVMNHLVDRFVKLAVEQHSIPVVLFIPRGESLRRDDVRYQRFADEIKKRYADLYVIDLMEHEFDRERFNILPYQGHASRYGNEVIARAIEQTYDRIRSEHELAPASTHLIK